MCLAAATSKEDVEKEKRRERGGVGTGGVPTVVGWAQILAFRL